MAKDKPIKLNHQRPFSYLPKQAKAAKVWEPKQFLSANYRGICTGCGRGVQKVRIGKYCQYCYRHGYVYLAPQPIPEDMRPWILRLPSSYRPKTAFICVKCTKTFASWEIFGALCDHVTHINRNLCCRFCCKSVSDKTIDDIKYVWDTYYRRLNRPKKPEVRGAVNVELDGTTDLYDWAVAHWPTNNPPTIPVNPAPLDDTVLLEDYEDDGDF